MLTLLVIDAQLVLPCRLLFRVVTLSIGGILLILIPNYIEIPLGESSSSKIEVPPLMIERIGQGPVSGGLRDGKRLNNELIRILSTTLFDPLGRAVKKGPFQNRRQRDRRV